MRSILYIVGTELAAFSTWQERIINLLRDNPGVSLSLSDIADAMALPVEDLAVYLEDLAARGLVINYGDPAEHEQQRGQHARITRNSLW